MRCEKCDNQLHYGAKYCTFCGEKTVDGAYAEDYKKTIWAKLDKAYNIYSMVTLKKFTGHIIFKILLLVLIGLFVLNELYGDMANIRLLNSDNYTITYAEKEDVYLLETSEDKVDLQLYVPITAEKIAFSGYKQGNVSTDEFSVEEYKKTGYTVVKDEFDYVIATTSRGDREIDSIRLIVEAEVAE